jgi:lambda repressor-like predicted transcriptional regulator
MKEMHVSVSSKWGGVGGYFIPHDRQKRKFAHFISDNPLRHLNGKVLYKLSIKTLYNTFKPTLVQEHSRIKLHNAVARLILAHVSEIWALRKKDLKKRLTSTERNCFRRRGGTSFFDLKKGIKNFGRAESRTS